MRKPPLVGRRKKNLKRWKIYNTVDKKGNNAKKEFKWGKGWKGRPVFCWGWDN